MSAHSRRGKILGEACETLSGTLLIPGKVKLLVHMLGSCFRKGTPSLPGELEAREALWALETPRAKPTG